MASIADVAKLAGCSNTLVSRYINGKSGVSAESGKKIQSAIDHLGYMPNAIARSLVKQHTNMIGVVLDNLCESFYFGLIDGIEDEMEQYGYNVVFCNGMNLREKQESYIDYFMQIRTEGILIYGSYSTYASLIARLKKTQIPFVIIEYDAHDEGVNNIVLDNAKGSEIVVDYLVKCGCRRICHIGETKEIQAARCREEGYLAAMKEHGLGNQIEIVGSGWSDEEGYDSVNLYLKGHRDLPDALYFSSDQGAFGGIEALSEHGIAIPDECMIVGFDDDMPKKVYKCYRPLTTIHQPLHEMGSGAMRLLVSQIQNQKIDRRRIVYEPTLVVRDTTRMRG